MQQATPHEGPEEATQLGEPKLVCRTSRKTLFFGYLLASLLCGGGVAVIIFLLSLLVAGGLQDVLGSIVLLAAGLLLLWGGGSFWRKTDRKRRVRVVVHPHGLSYRKEDDTWLIRRWEQIEGVRCRAWDHHEQGAGAIGGVPLVATTTWTTHEVIVQCRDGVRLVFTEELQNVESLAKVILEGVSRNSGCG
jgi:hypothetical protein